MKICLFDVQTRSTAINKTMAGGYGTSSRYGDSPNFLLKFLSMAKKRGVIVPLLVFGYLTRIFTDQGHEVILEHGQSIKSADLYLFYGSLVEYREETKMAQKVRNKYPKSKIGFIGLFPTVKPEIFMESADFVVKGEAENFFLAEKELLSLQGIYDPQEIDDINTLPFPDWSRVPAEKSRHAPFFGNKKMFPVIFGRGCSFSCAYYCAYPIIGGRKIRQRSIQNMIDELKYLKSAFDAQAVLFRDPNFSIIRKTTVELCNAIIDADLRMDWAVETHPDRLDKELLGLMKKAGCQAITIGVESRTKEVLKASKRQDVKEEHLREVVHYAEKIGISIMAGYILGQMEDTEDTLDATIKYAIELGTSYAQFVIATPYPGTSFYIEVENQLTTKDWTQYDTYTLVFQHPNLSSAILEDYKKKALIKFYFRPRWIFEKFLKKRVGS